MADLTAAEIVLAAQDVARDLHWRVWRSPGHFFTRGIYVIANERGGAWESYALDGEAPPPDALMHVALTRENAETTATLVRAFVASAIVVDTSRVDVAAAWNLYRVSLGTDVDQILTKRSLDEARDSLLDDLFAAHR